MDEHDNEGDKILKSKTKTKKHEHEPIEGADSNVIESDELHSQARRKFMNCSISKRRFKTAVLEAASDLSHEFHGPYLSRLLMSDLGRSLLDANHPASTFETVKKGFLFHLNSTGHYLVLREHLRHAVTHVIQQCGLVLRPSGFKNHREFQTFLHDMYIFLADELYEALNESSNSEFGGNIPKWDGRPNIDEASTYLEKMYFFAEEALAENDIENCHRLHLQRICRNNTAPEYWTDFAIMWCARGDDRMAEIALREALKLNPKHVHALILAGIIAARNKDERAIGFIGQALKMYPLAPEMLVLMASAHRMLGNASRSRFFFLKARLLHLILTGKETLKAETDLKNLRVTTPDNQPHARNSVQTDSDQSKRKGSKKLSESSGDSSKARKGTKSRSRENSQSSKGRGDYVTPDKMQVPPNTKNDLISQNDNESSRSGRKSIDSKASDQTLRSMNDEQINEESSRSSKSKNKKSDDDNGINKLSSNATKTSERSSRSKKSSIDADHITEMIRDENPLSSRRFSISGNDALAPESSSASRLSYDIPIEVNEQNMHQINLPPLGSTILFTWDVTQLSCPKEGGDGSGSAKVAQHFESNLRNNSTEMEGKVADSEIMQSYEQFIQSKVSSASASAPTGLDNSRKPSKAPSPTRKKETVSGASTGKSSISKTPRSGRKSKVPPADGEHQAQEGNATAPPNDGKDRKVWCERFGSEYIWTAQLLLKYHAHDFLDAVLSRELFSMENRSVPFCYLVAHSLNMTHRQQAAKVLLEEMVAQPEFQQNPYIWEQKGHAHYGLGEKELAIKSYEKCVEFSEPNQNLQIAYLRLGNLCEEMGRHKHAKSVLLKGAHLFPSLYIWIALGELCFRQGNYQEAESAFTHANRLDNTNPVIWGYLALVNLTQENQSLSEQCYKWAVRFGLKSGPLMDKIQSLQQQLGFGDPSFPRVPNCIPHQYYLKRLGRHNLLEVYREALEAPDTYFGSSSVQKLDETTREAELKNLLQKFHNNQVPTQHIVGSDEDDYMSDQYGDDSTAKDKSVVHLSKRPSQLFKSQTATASKSPISKKPQKSGKSGNKGSNKKQAK